MLGTCIQMEYKYINTETDGKIVLNTINSICHDGG